MKKFLFILLLVSLTFVGCKSNEEKNDTTKDVSIDDILNTAKDKMETDIMMEADGELLEGLTQISPKDLSEFRYYSGSTNLFVSSILVAKAKDDNLKDIEKSVTSFLDNQKEAYETYLADQYELLKKAELFTEGNYVILLVGNGAAEARSEIEKLFN